MEDTLTMQRLKALHAEWNINPPLALMVAAYFGIKPRERGNTEELIEKMMNM